MFVEAASRLNVKVLLLDSGINSPAKQINFQPSASSLPCGSEHIDGPFSSAPHIRELASKVDILTIEIEHVDANVLDQVLKEEMIKEVHPRPSTIKLIQDKYNQKVHLVSKGLPVAEYECVGKDESSPSDPTEAKEDQFKGALESIKKFGLPLMLKSRTQAYDGKGNFVLRSAEEDKIREAIKALGDGTRGLYCEKWAEFEREIAVMVVRSSSGEVKAYPAVETVHRDNICHTVYAPLRSSDPTVEARAREIAQRAVSTFEGAGVFGVEMFSMKNGELLINEIAPRPHNSGHYTIEACETSQYENHLRAILGYPLGSTALKVGSAAMVNILGLADLDTDPKALEKTFAPAVKSLEVPGSTVHLYGKTGCRKGRKMGHVTIVGQNDSVVKERLDLVLEALESATKASASPSKKLDKSLTLEGILSSSSSATSTSNTSSTSATLPPSTPYSPLDFSHPAPLVGIIMGSDSDLPVMLPAAHILKKFNVPFELSIVSAHRTPDRMREYSRSAPSRGLKCIIAGAGGAAHLPGMVAAQTALPVIGVPVKGSTLDGVDSLHSIVQMPVSFLVLVQVLCLW